MVAQSPAPGARKSMDKLGLLRLQMEWGADETLEETPLIACVRRPLWRRASAAAGRMKPAAVPRRHPGRARDPGCGTGEILSRS